MAARWIKRRLSGAGETGSETENNKKCRHGRIHNRSETSLRRRVMDRRSSKDVKVDPDSHSAEIKTIEVTVCSDAHRPESTVISKARSTVIDLSCVRDKRSFERKKRIEDLKTRKREEDKSCRGEYRFDTDAYLHEDKIREIMNMDQLEETLAEVLTISSDDMDDMFSSPRLSTDSEEIESSKDDLQLNFQRQSSADALDSLLLVPDLARVGIIETEDLEEMMKINREFDIKEFTQEDVDELLNVDSFYTTSESSVREENVD